jgi:hypothetical protein
LKTKIKTLWTSIALPAQPEQITMTSAAHIGRNRHVDAAENGRRDHAKRPDGDQCPLEVVELSVLARSTETVSDTANRMDQRISLLVVHLTAQASDIEVNDICRWIEIKIPDPALAFAAQ